MLSFRASSLIAILWSALVITLAWIEYSLEPNGFGITTQLVRSNEPVGFVATHPIFATTIHPNLPVISVLIVLPIAVAAGLSSLCRLLTRKALHRASGKHTAPAGALVADGNYETTPRSVMLLVLVAYGVLWALRVIK